MRIVFVYAGDPDDYRDSSPYSITKNVYHYLAKRIEVVYHRWDAAYDIDLRPDDILIGHPHYDQNTIIQRTFRADVPCRARCLIHPLHHQRIEDNWPFNDLAIKADKIFSICGPYWYDTIQDTVFAHWKPKIVRLDMAVNCHLWKHHKATFNNVGCRGIVYVGSAMPQKNLGMLTQIAQKMQHVRFDWYGGSGDHPLARLPNVHVEGWQDLGQDKVKEICYRNDLFVNTSSSDANPTTLLEFGLASGIIPICTETSGYWKDECFINIPHDVDAAARIISEWLNKPNEELSERSQNNRRVCEERYTWDRFCETIWNELQEFL